MKHPLISIQPEVDSTDETFKKAFEDLWEPYETALIALSKAQSDCDQLAEPLLQETYFKAFAERMKTKYKTTIKKETVEKKFTKDEVLQAWAKLKSNVHFKSFRKTRDITNPDKEGFVEKNLWKKLQYYSQQPGSGVELVTTGAGLDKQWKAR